MSAGGHRYRSWMIHHLPWASLLLKIWAIVLRVIEKILAIFKIYFLLCRLGFLPHINCTGELLAREGVTEVQCKKATADLYSIGCQKAACFSLSNFVIYLFIWNKRSLKVSEMRNVLSFFCASLNYKYTVKTD